MKKESTFSRPAPIRELPKSLAEAWGLAKEMFNNKRILAVNVETAFGMIVVFPDKTFKMAD